MMFILFLLCRTNWMNSIGVQYFVSFLYQLEFGATSMYFFVYITKQKTDLRICICSCSRTYPLLLEDPANIPYFVTNT